MIAHGRSGKPPLLDFDYEVIIDARPFNRPANYALRRITRVGEGCVDTDDVLHALRRLVDEVARRLDGRAPVLYGSGHVGSAIILLADDCERLAGPVVLNGSPLSYWAGASVVNPMRVAGGLLGSAWLRTLWPTSARGVLTAPGSCRISRT